VNPRSHGAGWSGREAAEEGGGEGRRASWVWEFRLLGGGGGAEGGDGDSIRVRAFGAFGLQPAATPVRGAVRCTQIGTVFLYGRIRTLYTWYHSDELACYSISQNAHLILQL
jgi:hypothetical protein